ncbi:MAG TPA: RcpC/CpaB family pilus assembly protein [Propionicimonas sp.]|jgi:pilus assembly protein CpaB|uniref:Flp pilus assembly protein CpaB n=1 Tax=Propionicimonas sp. TaxID=1955623 RepID=UPI002F40B40B
MQRRIIAAVAAVVLAGIGAVLLYSYVNNADARAMARLETTQVLVATKVIPAGTSGANLAPFVELKQLPKVAVVEGALTTTSEVADLEATSDLQVGEQVLASRFAKPNTDVTGSVEVPSDLQQMTVQLSPSRVMGTRIAAGDRVAVYISVEVNQVAVTKLALRDVLVTNVLGVPAAATGADNTEVAPSSDVFVTFAIEPKNTAQVVWGAEFGKLYLALEPKDGDHTSAPFIRVKSIFK